MSISLNGDGIISGVSTLTNPSEITVGTGASVFSPASNTLALGTNGSERVRVTSSGNIGIGTDNPTVFGTAYRTLQLNPAAGTGDGSAIRFMYDGGTANTNDLVIYTNSSQSYIRANGDRNLNIVRNGSTVATFNANGIALPSGLGIDFSATSDGSGTTTSELLDDYEEGTWTPTLTGFTNAGTITGRTKDYIKIGKQVTVWFDIFQSSNNMSFSDGATITGLPFSTNSISVGDQFHTHVNVQYYRGGGAIVLMTAYVETTDTIVIRGASANSDIRHIWGHVTYTTS